MLGSQSAAVAALLALAFRLVDGAQIPLLDQQHARESAQKSGRKLTGRFLQITDIHPDRFYQVYSSTAKDAACHRSSGPAGYYGAETSECDTPVSLVNATFDWIDKNIKDDIDFVIWTGDSARHDNDEDIPRSTEQVVSLNELMVDKFIQVFGRNKGENNPIDSFTIPIVPTLGNNDILPHNIFEVGPNRWTKTYLDIWRKFIPEEQRHQFEQGGWFSVEVIPNHLRVFSLNSLYFFGNNAAVDGCAVRSEPGYRQMEWLRIQLQFLRERGMKAIIIGHVPPARTEGKQSWDESCWQKYTLWMRQYRDVVAGSLYGHMNMDHFVLQDFNDIKPELEKGVAPNHMDAMNKAKAWDDEFTVESAASYFTELRDLFKKIPKRPKSLKPAASGRIGAEDMSTHVEDTSDDARPQWEVDALVKGKKGKKGDKKKDDAKKERKYLKKIGGEFGERYSVSHISPSVVPNYFPTIRIYEYNISGLEHAGFPAPSSFDLQQDFEDDEDFEAWKKGKKNRKRRFTVPDPPSKSAPPGPAYSPQTLSFLGFTQYYANLTRINNDFMVEKDAADQLKWREGKHKGKKPHDEDKSPSPKKFHFEVLYDTRNDSVYNVTDLTVPSYLDLAQRIARPKGKGISDASTTTSERSQDEHDVEAKKKGKKDKKKKKKKKKHHPKEVNSVWYTFLTRAFVGALEAGELEDQFGL